MSTFIRVAESRDVDEICTLLHTKMNARISIERWRRLMTYPWLADKPDLGRVVESDGRILGFVGLIYSDRMIGNEQQGYRKERFVSMSSWYLDKSMRGRGLGKGMLTATMDNLEQTFTQFTNSSKPIEIVKAMGYQLLDEYRYHWHKAEAGTAQIVLIHDVDAIRLRATPIQHQLLDDMQDMPVVPIWMEARGEQALMFFSVKSKREDVLWFDLLHTSNPELFTDCAQLLADSLLPDARAVLASDSRLVKPPPAGTIRKRLPVARYYLSDTVRPHEIDCLYSELQLLDLKLD